MQLHNNDIKQFGQLRKQLTPMLNKSHKELLERIQDGLGGSTVSTQMPEIKKLTHEQRVLKHLKF